MRAFGSSRRPFDEYVKSTPMPPSTSERESRRVAPARSESAYSSSLRSFNTVANRLSSTARWWKVSAPRLSCPTVRAWSSTAARSSPSVLTRATSAPVEESRTTIAPSPSDGVHHPSRT